MPLFIQIMEWADSQLVEGNDTRVYRETEPSVDFAVTDLPVVDSDEELKL